MKKQFVRQAKSVPALLMCGRLTKAASAEGNRAAHTKWNCKYQIVFASKYRRKIFYGEKRQEIGAILRELCKWKGIKIIEAEVCPDHVHMLVEIPPKFSVSSVMGYLKGKSSLMVYERWGNMKFKYRGKNTHKIQEYIKNNCMRIRCPLS